MVCSGCHQSTLDRLVSFGKKAPTEGRPEQTREEFSPSPGTIPHSAAVTAVDAERGGDISRRFQRARATLRGIAFAVM
jgi:hypothetical protein